VGAGPKAMSGFLYVDSGSRSCGEYNRLC